ncbi:EAL domain-containing protein [Psychrobacter aestuarii]|uniref:Cyclic di-GMP-binding protein FimX n=1 Tax=Psychrobacter aestuarii TaxID=556327 RepID=A0ABN0VLJ5_9GAMM|nr:GGDEF and EAL domain-containing protein [Psychrobacter aestuarii]
MQTNALLNLLVIDEDQLYAERIVSLLSHYYDEVNLGFLDDEEELLKALRSPWDVLVFGRAYDLTLTDVVVILQSHDLDLPIIGLMSDELAATAHNAEGLPATIDSMMVKALRPENEVEVVLSICLQHAGLGCRRALKGIRHILSEAEQRANILIKNSKSAVAYLDQGIHIFANDPYLELFGFESMKDIIGVPVIDLIADKDNVKEFKQFLRKFDKGNRDQLEFQFESRKMDGSTFEAKLQLAAATLEGAPVTQIIIQQNAANDAEIAKRLAAVERMDTLTGLGNRRGLEEQLELIHQKVGDEKSSAALYYIQLDNIGKISSSLGLQGVDATIKQVGYRLGEMIEEGYVSRFGDTTFTILVEHLTTQAVKDLAEQIRTDIAGMLIDVNKRTTSTTVSIGVVKIEAGAAAPQVLLERAIDAVGTVQIETKNHGDAYHLYDPSEHANSDDMALAEYLVKAISNNGFELKYQPIYDINTDSSDFFEVYLRLPLADASNTVLTPDHFMAVAKTHHLREKIDRWVLIHACKQLNDVRKQHPTARILVQLTSASLVDKQLPNVASQLIKAIGGAPGAITLQFSEQDVINHLTVAKAQFAALSEAGCEIAIHHFGNSAKSIEIADTVQTDMVRLSRNYIDNINNEDNLDTVKALITRANEHEIDVLMPYIEDAATMSVSWSVGARYLQGYYLEAPSTSMHFGTSEA